MMDSSQPETSFHMKLHPPVADVPLTIAGSSSKSTPIMNNTFSMANYGHNSYLDVSTSKEGTNLKENTLLKLVNAPQKSILLVVPHKLHSL